MNAGHFKQEFYHYTGFSKTLLNEAGDYTATANNGTLIEKRDYAQVGLRGDFKTGYLKHNYTLGVDRQWHYTGGARDSHTESGWNGNIYVGDPGNWPHPTFDQSDPCYTTRARTSGWSVMDIISTEDEKLNILVGLNGKAIKKIVTTKMVLIIKIPDIIMMFLLPMVSIILLTLLLLYMQIIRRILLKVRL